MSPKEPRQRPPLDEVFTSVNETLDMPCVILKIPATVAILALAPWVAQMQIGLLICSVVSPWSNGKYSHFICDYVTLAV